MPVPIILQEPFTTQTWTSFNARVKRRRIPVHSALTTDRPARTRSLDAGAVGRGRGGVPRRRPEPFAPVSARSESIRHSTLRLLRLRLAGVSPGWGLLWTGRIVDPPPSLAGGPPRPWLAGAHPTRRCVLSPPRNGRVIERTTTTTMKADIVSSSGINIHR